MKKFIALVLSLALLCGFAALAEADVGTKMDCRIEEGSYYIRIDDPEGDLGWVFETENQDVAMLYDASLDGDAFVARFDPSQDGEATVTARHYTGIACDELHTWDLRVEGNMVTECTGGSATMSPAEEENDPWVCGEWAERDTQFTTLKVEKNPERGWDVEAVSPLTHGAYIFKTTVYYDCEVLGFVYDKGKFWDAPTDGDAELGEARTAGTVGSFAIGLEGNTPENATLTWHDDTLGEDVVFERIEAVPGESDGSYYTFEGSGVAMKLPADFQPTEGEPAENVFYEASNDDVLLQVQPVEGDYADLDALMEHFNGLEYIVRSELVNFNGIDLVYSEGGDDDAMVYSLVSPEGTSYSFIFIPQSEQGEDAIQHIISTICSSESLNDAEPAAEDEGDVQETAVESYTDRAGAFTFSYDPDAFVIAGEEYQDDAEDSDLVITMNGTYAFWGNTMIQFQKTKIEDPEDFDDSFAEIEEAGIEVTRGEWNGFQDVHMYAFDDEDSLEQRFIVRPEEGVSLAVIVMVDKLDDEEMSMARDDAISAVLDTLSWRD